MDRFDRIFQLHAVLENARLPVPLARIQDALECSRATAVRIINAMRLFLGAPIAYDHERNGYHYDAGGEHPFELPGLWFNASELHALLVCQTLLREVQPGLLDTHIEPLRRRIEALLSSERLGSPELEERVRILSMAARAPSPRHFGVVATALTGRRRLWIRYHSRIPDEVTERAVSPQRLVHYRDNWYLDAWCHVKRGLRIFALERIRAARRLDDPAREVARSRLDAHYAAAYGIFAGRPRRVAVLRFSPERARWVAEEHWHPRQEGRFLSDGRYELKLPYGDSRELVMDILRHGPEVEVVAPKSLRVAVAERLNAAAKIYARAPC